MKIIKHIVFVKLNESTTLMINSLNGLADKMDVSTYEIISRWQNIDWIVPRGEAEAALFNSLKSRGYFVNDYSEEVSLKDKLFESLRKRNAKAKEVKSNITFVMSYDCNFNCAYCFEGAGGSTPSKSAVFTPEMIDAALSLSGDELRTIALFGGEPLLRICAFVLSCLYYRYFKKRRLVRFGS